MGMQMMSRVLVLIALCTGCYCAAAPKTKLKEITAVIKTFERLPCLVKLLDSIERHAPSLKVIVVDDSRNANENRKMIVANPSLILKYYALDFDVGVSAARNFALTKVNTKFVLMLDDDMVLTATNQLTELADVASSVHGIAGAELFLDNSGMPNIPFMDIDATKKQTISAATLLSLNAKRLSAVPEKSKHPGTGCIQASMVLPPWIAEASLLKDNDLSWDDKLKLSEAEDFFLRATEKRVPVHYCPALVKSQHDGSCTVGPGQDHERYARFRERGLYYYNLFFDKHNINTYSTPQGGMYFSTCAFGKNESDCGVAHMWKRDELKMCTEHGDCETHKVAIQKKKDTKGEGLFKCDASGKCDVPVL